MRQAAVCNAACGLHQHMARKRGKAASRLTSRVVTDSVKVASFSMGSKGAPNLALIASTAVWPQPILTP